ncbi:type II secretion system protein GspM [Dokdonella immobilis]|uniref:Type II secretion system protein M n=1 Tax=Dokdonella immobilis TaxID=578942 RepID=A0A1I5AKJ7_9GAMM|nr:type II secretion system protein M [Dokdonella immobilis]SFN62967.1 type II secretion system protein M (GspM) [Dokdonella immobilis]
MISAWWNGLSERDRRVLLIGAVVVAIFLVWSFVWHPLAMRRALLSEQLDGARRDLASMRVAQAEVEQLRNAGVRSRADRQGKSLLALADVTARGAGLDGVLKRLEPVGARSVRASFEFASFDSLIAWMEDLARDYGVQISDFSADRVDASGLVNARVTLEDIP